jgi:hypothetical protein
MNFPRIVALMLLVCFANAEAQTSTIRIACDGSAMGAAVSIDGRFKADCPLDVTVNAGTLVIRATKQIGGRELVFTETVRIGEGVVKRIEVQFAGAAANGAAQSAQVQAVDRVDAATRRYAIEKEEWERSMAACRPRFQEYQLKRQRDIRQLKQECLAISRQMLGRDWDSCNCNSNTQSICIAISDAEDELRYSDVKSWCLKQFPEPKMAP